ncbi:hypothetical protein D3C80_1470270 [compost metagenome]
MGGTGFTDNRHFLEVLVCAFYSGGRTLCNDCPQHVCHQISGLLGEYLLRIHFMLVNDFALGINDLLNHVGIIKSAVVADRRIGVG